MVNMSWATKRQLIILGIVAIHLLAVAAIFFALYVFEPASCFDKKQNQDELGVDCGGACVNVCTEHVLPISVIYTRAIPDKNLYDAVAYLENRNYNFGIAELSYRFDFFDEENIFIGSRRGVTILPPNGRYAIFEAGFDPGEKKVSRVDLFLPNDFFFNKMSPPPIVSVLAEDFQNEDFGARLSTTVSSGSKEIPKGTLLTALLYDDRENVIGASQTILDGLLPETTETLFFTWNHTFVKEPARFEIIASPSRKE